MGYFMRYLFHADAVPDFETLENALLRIDSQYSLRNTDLPGMWNLMFNHTRLALIEINVPDDEIFVDDLQAFSELLLRDTRNVIAQEINADLQDVNCMIVIEAFWNADESEAVLEKVDPIWEWLDKTYHGVAQADSEGFYRNGDIIYACNFTL